MNHYVHSDDSDREIFVPQTSAADGADVHPDAPATAPAFIRTTVGLLRLVIPVGLLLCLALIVQNNSPKGGPKYTDPRDRVLSWAAWLSGSEFNPKENPFSSQYEFELPEMKPIDWQEFTFQPQQWQNASSGNSR
jgi:hypothetical protein